MIAALTIRTCDEGHVGEGRRRPTKARSMASQGLINL
jgi:hypothetical protein